VPARRYRRGGPLVVAVVVLAGCGGATARHAAPTSTAGATTTTTGTVATAATPAPTAAPATSTSRPPTSTTHPVPTTAAGPAFSYTVSTVTASDLPHTWRAGCPVAPAALRSIHLSYWGFDGKSHRGSIVVNSSVVTSVVSVFRTLYAARFAIYEMVPVDAYGGDDNAAAAADDTSGFNCRNAVAPGPPQWSAHAFGEAIDVNDVQNPYVYGSTIIPAAGAEYLNRSDVRPGMAEPGGVLVRAFASVGWQWGGRWSPGTDYQHFSSTGG
jgi:hypothetical protein